MKVLVDAGSQQFLGAAIYGIGDDEIVHSIVDLMYARAPYTVMKNAVHIHPTVTELILTVLEGVMNHSRIFPLTLLAAQAVPLPLRGEGLWPPPRLACVGEGD
jgi:hypothetical protein